MEWRVKIRWLERSKVVLSLVLVSLVLVPIRQFFKLKAILVTSQSCLAVDITSEASKEKKIVRLSEVGAELDVAFLLRLRLRKAGSDSIRSHWYWSFFLFTCFFLLKKDRRDWTPFSLHHWKAELSSSSPKRRVSLSSNVDRLNYFFTEKSQENGDLKLAAHHLKKSKTGVSRIQ